MKANSFPRSLCELQSSCPGPAIPSRRTQPPSDDDVSSSCRRLLESPVQSKRAPVQACQLDLDAFR